MKMQIAKRIALILLIIITTMLIIPLIAINTVKADAGMLVTLVLFFAVYPIISIWIGIISGRDVRHFWFSPILIAVLFWLFSSLTYKTAFPVVYSVIYFVLCFLSMVITGIIVKKKN